MKRSDPNEVRPDLGPLFAPRLREMSHSADPSTSTEAAARMVASGALGRGQRLALDLVTAHPGLTADELGGLACEVREELLHARLRVARRLSELRRAGLVYVNGKRDGLSTWAPGKETR